MSYCLSGLLVSGLPKITAAQHEGPGRQLALKMPRGITGGNPRPAPGLPKPRSQPNRETGIQFPIKKGGPGGIGNLNS